MSASPPSLRVRGTLADALSVSILGALDERALREWLMARRWFAAKARPPSSVRIADVIPLEWGGGGGGAGVTVVDAIARVEVDTGEGVIHHYQLPLALRLESSVDPALPPLVIVESDRERGVVVDGTGDEQFRRRLAAAFSTETRFGDARARWVVEPLEPGGVALDVQGGSRVLQGEQSNTSIVFADQAILKLFRRLERGVHPDVEIGRFLTGRLRYPHTPRLLGTIAFKWAGGEPAVAGMLQRYLPGSRDAWIYTLERLTEHLRGDGSDFAAEAADLGRITRELHHALASVRDDDAFAPERAESEHVNAWAAAARQSAESALAFLEIRLDTLPPSVRAQAGRLLSSRDLLLERIAAAARAVGNDAGVRIRHHGDFHLGQVLRTEEGTFVIIDFEGEPARPLAERRAKHSPLRDVAGMLRSFAYAAAVGVMENPAVGTEARALAWEEGARAAFLGAYFEVGTPGALLPRRESSVPALISLFELEKVSYELGYELNNRPDWVWIPLRGIERGLDEI